MNERSLNIEYICNKTQLDKNDELIPIILEMIKESYKSGLKQAKFDNMMGIYEQREKFINYLETEINSCQSNIFSDGVKYGFQLSLSKYKELTGVLNERN